MGVGSFATFLLICLMRLLELSLRLLLRGCAFINFSTDLTMLDNNISVEVCTMERLEVSKLEYGVQHPFFFDCFCNL